MIQKIRGIVAWLLTPVVFRLGKIHAPWSHKLAIEHYEEIVQNCKPGDILLSATAGELTNLFNPGKYKHAAIYLGNENGVPHIAEAIGKGVVRRTLYVFLASKDEVVAMRARLPIYRVNLGIALAWLNRQYGKPYDYQFELGTKHGIKAFYCSELAYSFLGKAIPGFEFTLRVTMGVATVVPTDFYMAQKHFLRVIETKGEKITWLLPEMK